jgi:hypothetical protein
MNKLAHVALWLALAAALAFGAAQNAAAQTSFTMPPPAGVSVMGVQVVSSCGAASGLVVNGVAYIAMDTTGTLCTTGAGSSSGISVYFVQPTASDNHAVIKNGNGQVYKITTTNNQATINYIRLYDAGTGFNGCNSATNLKYQMAIPGSATATGFVDQWNPGMAFSNGISVCVTSGYATNDTTNATASAMSVNIGYK